MNYLTLGKKPYLIGLTGPIGSGKSLVRKMLEHLGALTIDADELAHLAYLPGNPGYDGVVKRFGSQALDEEGFIDRRELGRLAFNDQRVLKELEEIIHPLVVKAVKTMLEYSPMPIIAVEAIKLLESGLKDLCETIWIVDSPDNLLVERLEKTRGMSRKEVLARLERQANFSASKDERAATITNHGGKVCLWNEVRARWDCLAMESDVFKEAYHWTNETYQSFYMPLIQLSIEAAEDLKGQFTSAKTLEDTFGFMCNHLIWETIPLLSGRNFVITQMDNRTMNIMSLAETLDRQQLSLLIPMIEDFGTLHLCTRLNAPFYEELISLFEEIGYDRYTNSGHSEKSAGFPFRKGFSKTLLPEINYFKDKQP
jgi:dephospho-CoA kinase